MHEKDDVLDPERMIIDPHHHLWKGELEADYLLTDYWADTCSGHHVEQSIFVECSTQYYNTGPQALKSLGETTFCTDLARESVAAHPGHPRLGGIVAFVDLTLGTRVKDILCLHVDASNGLVCGIRHAAAWDASGPFEEGYPQAPKGLYMRGEFREGFAQLAPMGLSYDAWNYHHQLPELIDLARTFPDTRIILDHFGGLLGIGVYIHQRSDIVATWKRDIEELSHCANVYAKLGGLAMPINGFGWDKRSYQASTEEFLTAQRPYYLHTIACFGPRRCMFESNFPMDKVSISYRDLWNAFKKMTIDFSEDEKNALFRETAMHVYGLNSVN